MIQITTPPIGEGEDRIVYIHPTDKNKAIKLVKPNRLHKQSEREIKYYNKLLKRKNISWKHIPKFYGEISTNKGKGFVVELIRDYDGNISKNLDFYIKKFGLAFYKEKWEELKSYFLKERIITTSDIAYHNILVKKIDEDTFIFVLIDALGDTVFIDFLNYSNYLLKRKITRRFNRAEKFLVEQYQPKISSE